MFSTLLLAAAALPFLPALADPVPSEPAPGSIFNEGETCHVSWEPDTTGTWTEMSIQLMTGDNFDMVHLTTVITVDGTDTSTHEYDFPCPAVEPNSAIYFYQFSSPVAPDNKTWTGRFAIATASGETTPPSESTQPNGEDIPWGSGALEDPSSATPPPPYLEGGSGSGGSANSTRTATRSRTSTSARESATAAGNAGGSGSSSRSTGTGTSSPASQTGGSGVSGALGLGVDAHVGAAGTALVAVALAFSTLF